MGEKLVPLDLLIKAERASASAIALLDLGDVDGACNRAYYAMFDAARAAILSLNLPGRPDIGKTHRGTLSAFSEQFVKTGAVSRELGVLLKHAETFRYVADYEGGSVELQDAQEIVQQAQFFVSALRLLLLPQTKTSSAD
jgi:uncharacterized protein (UPF0332 family)